MIVDLAGSERVGKSMSKGESLKEAIKINQSISALGNCVSALASLKKKKKDSAVHVPYRDSKLTRLLTNTLSGNSKSWICTNIAPITAHCEETISTLHFATRAMRVKVNATLQKRFVPEQDAEELERLREEVSKLRERLETWDEIVKRNAMLEIENARLRKVLEQTSDRAAKNYLARFDEMSRDVAVEEEK